MITEQLTEDVKSSFLLIEPTRLILDVYELSGRRVRSIDIGSVGAGTGSIAWDGLGESGEDLSTGIYFLRLSGNEGMSDTRSVLILDR